MTDLHVFILPPNDRLAVAVERAGARVPAEVSDADAIIFNGDTAGELARNLHDGIRWVQIGWSGIDSFEHLLDDGRTWTSASGIYGRAIAEHTVALVLAAAHNLHTYARARTWTGPSGRSLAGSHACVIGAGGIGSHVARLLLALGVDVTVLSRSASPVSGATARPAEDLSAVLPEADWVVLALPLVPETRGLIGAPEMALMRPDAWIVNVARGGVVDASALIAALESGQIGGAALDVTDPEPLPDDHPLWALPNVLITPHTACPIDDALEALAMRVEENVRRWVGGQPLIAQVSAIPSVQ